MAVLVLERHRLTHGELTEFIRIPARGTDSLPVRVAFIGLTLSLRRLVRIVKGFTKCLQSNMFCSTGHKTTVAHTDRGC